mgnify:CR=1 FL=1
MHNVTVIMFSFFCIESFVVMASELEVIEIYTASPSKLVHKSSTESIENEGYSSEEEGDGKDLLSSRSLSSSLGEKPDELMRIIMSPRKEVNRLQKLCEQKEKNNKELQEVIQVLKKEFAEIKEQLTTQESL